MKIKLLFLTVCVASFLLILSNAAISKTNTSSNSSSITKNNSFKNSNNKTFANSTLAVEVGANRTTFSFMNELKNFINASHNIYNSWVSYVNILLLITAISLTVVSALVTSITIFKSRDIKKDREKLAELEKNYSNVFSNSVKNIELLANSCENKINGLFKEYEIKLQKIHDEIYNADKDSIKISILISDLEKLQKELDKDIPDQEKVFQLVNSVRPFGLKDSLTVFSKCIEQFPNDKELIEAANKGIQVYAQKRN